jgi:hypothetical protein
VRAHFEQAISLSDGHSRLLAGVILRRDLRSPAAPALRSGSRAAALSPRKPVAWCGQVKRSARLLCKEEGKAKGEEAQAPEEAAAAAEVVGPEEPQDPFAGLDLDSKEFLQRKVDVLEKELQEANARVAELEGDAAAAEPLVAKGIMKSTKVCPPPTLTSGLLLPQRSNLQNRRHKR